MKELLEYRVFLVDRFCQAAMEFCEACGALEPDTKFEGEWSLHQIAAHVRDLNHLVYEKRVREILVEDNPLFENFDPEAWMMSHYEPHEPMTKILDEFKSNVDVLCETLSALPVEAWSRESRHETIGDKLPLQLWVERNLAHIEEHLKEIKSHS
jgi:hypothetical protein